jgi:hypothetical protein
MPPKGMQLKVGVVIRRGRQLSLIERPPRPLNDGLLWSGMAFFSREVLFRLKHLKKWFTFNRPVGSLFNSLKVIFPLRTFEVPAFINVNTAEEYNAAQFVSTIEQVKSRKVLVHRLLSRVQEVH